ncbi:MAG: hypothetical protein HYX93_03085 [Chloroflexi bacterium]|nr:hypothetical protein [Chloroflexota bacterium]
MGYPPVSFPRPAKKWSRICEKAASVLSENANCNAQEAADRIRDIAGGRMLVIGLNDLNLARLHLESYVTNYRRDVSMWEFEDFVETPRPGGFRALAGGVLLQEVEEFPFELQIMTPLQHAWDQLQHPVYEKARSGGRPVPDDVRLWFEDLSRRFYELDMEISKKQLQYRASGLL